MHARSSIHIRTGFFILTILALITGGCSDSSHRLASNDDDPLSSDKAITAFSFTTAANPELGATITGAIDETNATIALAGTLDLEDVAGLKATFTTTGSVVSIAGVTQESGVTANDFNAPLTYRVAAEDGTTRDYTVCVAYWLHPSGFSDTIGPDGQNAISPRVAVDNNGNVLIVWHQSDGSNNQIFMSEYRNGAWSHPAGLSDNISPDGQNASNVDISMDTNGNVLIVWEQSDGSDSQIFMSEYRNGVWSHPAGLSDNISPDGQDVYSPRAAMDENGNALIVWTQSDGSNNQIFMSEYRGGAWDHPDSLADNLSPDGQHASNPAVAMDNNGNALIVWTQSDGSDSQIFMSEYRGGAWDHPTTLSDNISPDGAYVVSVQVAMDNNGNALIVWDQSDGSFDQIFLSEYRNGAWTHPAELSDNISPDGEHADTPQVAMDDDGQALVVWIQQSGLRQVFMSEYRNGTWIHPAGISDYISPGGRDTYQNQVAMDQNGNAVIVWYGLDGSYNQVFKSEYRGGAWTHPASLADNISLDGQSTYNPWVAMDDNGNALVVWRQSDGDNYRIFKSEYRFWE